MLIGQLKVEKMNKYWDINVNFCVQGDTEEEARDWLENYLNDKIDMRTCPDELDEWVMFDNSDIKV